MYNKKTAKQAKMPLLYQDGIVWKLTTCNRLIMKIFITTTIIFFMLIDMAHSIQCYRCEVSSTIDYNQNDTQVTVHKCLNFNGSQQYITQCPYSTMCLKKVSTYTLNNGKTTETVTRDCAPQTNSTDVFRNGEWHTDHLIHEVYEEGCFENKGNHLSGASLKRCFCRGDLCNSSTNLQQNINKGFIFNSLMALTVILLPKVLFNNYI